MLYLTPPQPYPPSTRLLPTKVKRREIATASTLKTSLKKQSSSVQSLICILSQDSCVVGNPECKCPFKRHFRGIKISVFACSFTRDKRRSICECVWVCPQDFQLTQIWFGVNSGALARWFTWWLTAARCCQSINYHKGLNRERWFYFLISGSVGISEIFESPGLQIPVNFFPASRSVSNMSQRSDLSP